MTLAAVEFGGVIPMDPRFSTSLHFSQCVLLLVKCDTLGRCFFFWDWESSFPTPSPPDPNSLLCRSARTWESMLGNLAPMVLAKVFFFLGQRI